MQVLLGHPPTQRRKRLLDPADRSAGAERQLGAFVTGFQRKPQGGAQLRLVLDQLARQGFHDRVESGCRVFGGRLGQQGSTRHLGEGRNDERALVGEVAAGGGAGNVGRTGSLLDCGSPSTREVVPRCSDEGGACAGLLLGATSRLIWDRHVHHGTIVSWYLSPISFRTLSGGRPPG